MLKMWYITAFVLALFYENCCGFVLMSSAISESGENMEGQLFSPGKSWNYNYTIKVILNEKGRSQKDVGFILKSKIRLESIWGSGHSRILKISFDLPQVLIRSKDVDGFSGKTSPLTSMYNEPFYVLWHNGVVEKILFRSDEETTMVNLKKGIASLFQYQLLDLEMLESDASGVCKVRYMLFSTRKINKTKLNCINDDLPIITNPELLLATKVHSTRTADYDISINNEFIENVKSEERHEMYLSGKEEIGNKVEVHQNLDFIDSKSCHTMKQATYEKAKHKLIDDFGLFTEDNLLTHRMITKGFDAKDFVDVISENRDHLMSSNLGKLTSAKALIPLVKSARASTTEEIIKGLTSNKNQNILPQIYDILGYAQTIEAHNAVIKQLHFDDEAQADNIERYLWCSSLSIHPHPNIITDLLNKYKRTLNIPKKIQETLLLSISSMAHRLSKLPKTLIHSKLIHNVQETLINNLDAAKGAERMIFLRALRNLKVPGITSKLLEVVKHGMPKEVVLAWQAIRAMEPTAWTDDVLSTAHRTFYQLDKLHDSSSRTLAADIILESNPSDKTLKGFLYHMIKEDRQFEVQQYVFQQIKMLSDENATFRASVLRIISNDNRLNNYSTLSPKGLSTALRRTFMNSQSSNGSLLTAQEMSSGIVKRGVVTVMMEKNGQAQEMFSLGIFSGGLGNFMSSERDSEDESTIAGMELSILGTQIRPFTFFEGHGQLMGHVWSGTASERTTAFQALILLQDHQQQLRLGSGLIVDVDTKGGASFDLSGNAEVSLWYRNAQALITKSFGFYGIGSMRLDTPFVNLAVEYQMSIEPTLMLNADIDFSNNVALCLRLSQPESIFRYDTRKFEHIPDSAHTLRRIKERTVLSPGRTYILNRKNSDMCDNMFK